MTNDGPGRGASQLTKQALLNTSASNPAEFARVVSATAGQYEILGQVGRGGMATVYLAHDISLDRKVAIKVMSTAMSDAGLAERFRLEARTSAQLSHPHIIPIYAARQNRLPSL